MKRLVAIGFSLALLCLPLRARVAELHSGFADSCYTLSWHAAYCYTSTDAHHAAVDIQTYLPVHRFVALHVGVQALSTNNYSFSCSVQPKYALPVGELYADAMGKARLLARDHQWDAVAAISLGYRFDYLDLQLGVYARFMAGYVEPANFLYRCRIYARPQSSCWNIHATVSNMDDFQVERTWMPLFLLGASWSPAQHWQVMLDAECKPTGIIHLNAAFYGAYMRVGAAYRF